MLSDMGFSYFYINSKNKDDLTFASYSHMLHLYQHYSNQTKWCWAFWLTNHNQEEGKSCSWKQMAFVCLLCIETQSLQPLCKCVCVLVCMFVKVWLFTTGFDNVNILKITKKNNFDWIFSPIIFFKSVIKGAIWKDTFLGFSN